MLPSTDLGNFTFFAGALALALVSRLVMIIGQDGHAAEMAARYQQLHHRFQTWAEDATTVLTGETVLFDDIQITRDPIFTGLTVTSPSL